MEFGVRLTADSSGLVGEGRAARAEIDNMRASWEGLNKSAQTNRDSFKALDDQLASFMARLSPAYNAVKQLDTGQDLLNRSLDAGLLSHKQYDDALARLTTKYGPAVAGAAALSGGHSGLATQTSFATREVRALFDELSSGRSRQAIGTMTLLTTRFLNLGPAGLAALLGVAALTGALVLGIVHSESMSRALAETEARFASTGRAGLLSGGQVKGLIDQLALLPGISRTTAEQTVNELAAVPTLSGAAFQQLALIVNDFAYATGKKVPAAAQELARALEDPLKGAQALDKQFNLLTADQLLHIETLVRQGRTYDAHQVLIKALEERFKGLHHNALTPLQGATNELGNAWDRLMKRLGDSSIIQGAYGAVVGAISYARRALDTDVMTAAYATGNPAAAAAPAAGPGATASAASWDQQHQAYIAGLEIEVKTALAVADSYRGVGDQLKNLREQRALLQSAMMAASITGDREASGRIGRGLAGNREALARIAGTDPAAEEARRLQTALELANEQNRMNSLYGGMELSMRHGTEQAGIGAIADPIARAQAQLNMEKKLRDESIANAGFEASEKERLLEQSNQFYLAKQNELNEQLKPVYRKNLDAWADNNRLMRDNWNREMLAIQQTGENMFIKFVTTGKLQIQDLVNTIETELARSLYRQIVGKMTSVGGSGSGDVYDSGGVYGTDFHSGGVVGSSAGPMHRVPFGTFIGAPRLHGGLAADEFPAILQRGETVLPRGTNSNTVHAPLHLTISAPGADAGSEARIRSMLQDQLPKALYAHRRSLMAVVNDQRTESGRSRL